LRKSSQKKDSATSVDSGSRLRKTWPVRAQQKHKILQSTVESTINISETLQFELFCLAYWDWSCLIFWHLYVCLFRFHPPYAFMRSTEGKPCPMMFRFDNSYARLPERFYARLPATPVAAAPATVVAPLEPRPWAAASQAEAFAAALQATQGKPGAKAPALATAPAGPAASQGSPKGPAGAKPPTVSQDASEVLASAPGTLLADDAPVGATTEGFHGVPIQPSLTAGGTPTSPEVPAGSGGRGMVQLSAYGVVSGRSGR
jgi:hypothetical protein